MESISQNQNQFWFLSTLPYNFENVFNMVTGCKLDISLLFSFLSSTGKTDVTLENPGETVFSARVQSLNQKRSKKISYNFF